MSDRRQPRELEDTNGPQQWYDQLPFVTKHWLTTTALMTFFANFEIIPVQYLAFVPEQIKDKFEIWRLVSNFVFLGTFGPQILIMFLILYKFSLNYESQTGYDTGGGGGTADYIFMIMFGAAFILLTGAAFKLGAFYGITLIIYVTYIWCKRDPTAKVNLMGFATIQAMYVPWVLLAVHIFAGWDYKNIIQAFAIGHLYYFLAEVVPRTHAKMYLNTPDFLISKFGIGEYTPPAAPVARTTGFGGNTQGSNAPQTGTHNWGRAGQRLGRD